MPEKPFEDMQGGDPLLRKRFLDANGGLPPDNFVESAEGGGVDVVHLAEETVSEEKMLVGGLDRMLKGRGAKTNRRGALNWD